MTDTRRIAVTLQTKVDVGKTGRVGSFEWVYNNAIRLVPKDYVLRGLEVRGDGNVYTTLTTDTDNDFHFVSNEVLNITPTESPLRAFGTVVKIEAWGVVA